MGAQFLYPRIPHLFYAAVNFATNGDNEILAALLNNRYNIHRLWLVVSAPTNLTFKDGASTNFSGAVPMSANGGLTFDITGEPWFSTTLGNGFVINQDGLAQVSGMIYYAKST